MYHEELKKGILLREALSGLFFQEATHLYSVRITTKIVFMFFFSKIYKKNYFKNIFRRSFFRKFFMQLFQKSTIHSLKFVNACGNFIVDFFGNNFETFFGNSRSAILANKFENSFGNFFRFVLFPSAIFLLFFKNSVGNIIGMFLGIYLANCNFIK